MTKFYCEDCVLNETDACRYGCNKSKDYSDLCPDLLVEQNRAYEKGRAEAIDEFVNVLNTEPLSSYAIDIIKHWGKKLKEKQNETYV